MKALPCMETKNHITITTNNAQRCSVILFMLCDGLVRAVDSSWFCCFTYILHSFFISFRCFTDAILRMYVCIYIYVLRLCNAHCEFYCSIEEMHSGKCANKFADTNKSRCWFIFNIYLKKNTDIRTMHNKHCCFSGLLLSAEMLFHASWRKRRNSTLLWHNFSCEYHFHSSHPIRQTKTIYRSHLNFSLHTIFFFNINQ